jgi:hypothetical protein
LVKKGKVVNKKDYDYDDEDYAPAKIGMSTGALIVLVLAEVCLLSIPVIAVVTAIALPNQSGMVYFSNNDFNVNETNCAPATPLKPIGP